MITKDNLQNLLKKNIVSINFTKTNGEERTMQCTLREDVVRPHVKKTERVKKINEDILSVWDIEKDAFRSFRLENLKKYKVIREGFSFNL
jgi:hypothetical protein